LPHGALSNWRNHERSRFNSETHIDEGIRKLTNFIHVSNLEIANILRIVGKDAVKKLGLERLVALKKDLAEATGVMWLSGKNVLAICQSNELSVNPSQYSYRRIKAQHAFSTHPIHTTCKHVDS